ncbi:hypothetical protein SKAU_G00396610 [Synaphobranchus kaupii]|uniref:glutathione transferase n=1 Tax=Synaphobranchus kaupii TaxID=118154 RepID=A0A9Q1ECJ8_SYNKA|nr:hypothetical protein SKAU_G00396610 [Synaphobranchus kaupii]
MTHHEHAGRIPHLFNSTFVLGGVYKNGRLPAARSQKVRLNPQRLQEDISLGSPKMAPYTITYFAVRGRCGAMRIALADLGQDWKENVITFDDWTKGELKSTCVFGQLPKLEDGDLALFQSNAVLRYLGRKHGAYGKDDREAAFIDMMVDGAEDLRLKYVQLIYKEYDTGKEAYLKELPKHLSVFDAVLSKNKSGFLVGDKVSIADYTLLDTMLNHEVLCGHVFDKFPALKSFVEKMSARPKLKDYLESDAYKKLPINGNGKQ